MKVVLISLLNSLLEANQEFTSSFEWALGSGFGGKY